MATDKNDRRDLRDSAVKGFNALAQELNIPTIAKRSSNSDVLGLYKNLCEKAEAEQLKTLRAEREKWLANGGCDLAEAVLKAADRRTTDAVCQDGDEEAAGLVSGHHILKQTFYNVGQQAFRLRARAFMLTYNSLAFLQSLAFWTEFVYFVKDRANHYEATFLVLHTRVV